MLKTRSSTADCKSVSARFQVFFPYSGEALITGTRSSDDVHFDGTPANSHASVEILKTGLDFLSTMKIPLLSGRALTPTDFASAAATGAAMRAVERAHDAA